MSKIIWKEPLTQRELLYSRLISKGVLSNVIAKDYKIPVEEQKLIDKSLFSKRALNDEDTVMEREAAYAALVEKRESNV